MFKELFKFEVFYQAKQRAFPLFALLFLGLGIFVGRQGFAENLVNYNASYQVNFHAGLFSLGAVFIIMFFAISATLRDEHHQMESIIYSTSILKKDYFWSRFLGVFIFSLLAFTPFYIGYGLAIHFSDLDPERLANFNVFIYLQPWLYFTIPNIFICSSIIFAVSTLSKSNIATYVSAVFIYMLYFLCAMFLNSPLMAQAVPASPESMIMASIFDPFGISAFFEQTQYWTAYDKNQQLLSLSGLFLVNRLIWILFSGIVLAITYKVFSFRALNKTKIKKIKINKEKVTLRAYKTTPVVINFNYQIKAFINLCRLELKSVFKSIPFLAILIMWIIIVFTSINSTINGGGQYGDSLYPFTNLLVELFVDPLSIFSIILVVFYSGELVWRERSVKFSGIVDCTPVENWVFFASKFISLILLPTILIITAIVLCVFFQISKGFYQFDMHVYLSVFYHYGVLSLVFAMFGLFVQSLVSNKFLGMGLTGLIIILALKAPLFGVEHPLFSPAFLPRISFSNMVGISQASKMFNHLALYWLSIGAILSIVSFKLWQRGLVKRFIENWKRLGKLTKRVELISICLLFSVFMASGASIYYNVNVIQEYTTVEERLDHKENYERKFKKWSNLEVLSLVGINNKLDVFAKERRYTVTAENTLKNNGSNAIDTVFISVRIPLNGISLENGTLLEKDSVYGTYLFVIKPAIQMNQSIKFSYSFEKELLGFSTDKGIVEGGSYITQRSFEPILSYREGLEIQNRFERKKRNLPQLEERVTDDSHLAVHKDRLSKVSFETVLSTDLSATGLSIGTLEKQWTKENRNYYHFKAKIEVMPTIAYLAGDYKIKEIDFRNIKVSQYFNKEHAFNIDTIQKNTVQALAYCLDNFGSYPTESLKIVEVPSTWPMGGFAHPGLITMTEDRLYLTDISNSNSFNLVAKRSIHEVAHQWWGHVLLPKGVEGGSLFVEGFAKYTEAVVMEKHYGKKAVYQLGETANRSYFRGRAYASTTEPPLYLVFGQSYLSYGKSYTAMLALRDLIGEVKLNKVLNNLVERFRDDANFEIITLYFLEELYQVSTKEQQVLIDDWFKRTILYDVAIEETSYKKLETGKYEVNIKIDAKRNQVIDHGKSKKIDINEELFIGLFDAHPSEISNIGANYYKKHRIITGTNEIKIIMDTLPNYISIDPFITRNDENIVDNTVRL